MLLLIIRLLLFFSCLFNVLYALGQLRRFRMPRYYKCAFYASVSMLYCSVFYIALSATESWNHVFTLADFGLVASYLFIIVANKKFIPKEYDEQNEKACIPGILTAIAVGVIFITTIALNPSAENIASNIINGIPIVLCTYYCVKVIINRYNNPFEKGLKNFCILNIIQMFFTVILQLALGMDNQAFLNIVIITQAISYPFTYGVNMYFLRKGLRPWKI